MTFLKRTFNRIFLLFGGKKCGNHGEEISFLKLSETLSHNMNVVS